MKLNEVKILSIIVMAVFIASCKKSGSDSEKAAGTPGAPTIEKIEFTSQSSAKVYISSITGTNEVNIKGHSGTVSNHSGSSSPITVSTPFGQVLEIKARAVNGSSQSDYSSTSKVLASVNIDKGLSRIELMEIINKMRAEGTVCDGVAKPPVPKLIWDDKLEVLSLAYAKDMNENNASGGTGSDGKTFKDRLTDGGFVCQAYRELLVKGPTSLTSAMNVFTTNVTACNIMMSSQYKYLSGANDNNNWVVDITE
jgi:uncharacterized protein YkwD